MQSLFSDEDNAADDTFSWQPRFRMGVTLAIQNVLGPTEYIEYRNALDSYHDRLREYRKHISKMKGKGKEQVKRENDEHFAPNNMEDEAPTMPEAPESLLRFTQIVFDVRAAVLSLGLTNMEFINIELVSKLREQLRANNIHVYYPPEFNQNLQPIEFSPHAQNWLTQFTHCSIMDYYAIFGYPSFPV